MHYICTICSKEKSLEKKLLPAIERYLSPRVKHCFEIANHQNLKYLILSGEYGFIQPYSLIPFYDHLLSKDDIGELLPILQKQNEFLEITMLDCIMEPKEEFGWNNYYEILEEFAEKENIKITFCLYKE